MQLNSGSIQPCPRACGSLRALAHTCAVATISLARLARAESLRKAVRLERARLQALVAAALLGLWVDASVAFGQEPVCDVRLAIELDPAVPDVNREGFLSSLLNRHFNYRLELLHQNEQDPADIEVRLTGPGPEYRCQRVIETMRRDARVQTIRIESTQVAARSSAQLRAVGALAPLRHPRSERRVDRHPDVTQVSGQADVPRPADGTRDGSGQ